MSLKTTDSLRAARKTWNVKCNRLAMEDPKTAANVMAGPGVYDRKTGMILRTELKTN